MKIKPFSTARLQQVSQLCFATFIFLKNHKIANSSKNSEAKDKIDSAVGFLTNV
jgi:hypothetical protein